MDDFANLVKYPALSNSRVNTSSINSNTYTSTGFTSSNTEEPFYNSFTSFGCRKRQSLKKSCTNCGSVYHLFRHCTSPMISLGLACLRYSKGVYSTSMAERLGKNMDPSESLRILVIQRKDTLAYIELVKGKYRLEDSHKLIKVFLHELTLSELQFVLENINNFPALWQSLWKEAYHPSSSNRTAMDRNNEYKEAEHKFNKNKLLIKKVAKDALEKGPGYTHPEIEIPKGKRHMCEKDYQTSVREFIEETAYHDFQLLKIAPISEQFTATNNKEYKHVYFFAKALTDQSTFNIDEKNSNQINEVSDIAFLNEKELLSLVRDYETEKRNILREIFEKHSKNSHLFIVKSNTLLTLKKKNSVN